MFTDYDAWHLVLNGAQKNDFELTAFERRWLFKKSFSRSKWHSLGRSGRVQMVVPRLDLRLAKEIWVRNKDAQKLLIGMGFRNIHIRRLNIDTL